MSQVGPMVEAQMLERFADIYSDAAVESEGSHTLVYRYTFRTAPTDQGRTAMEAQEGWLRTLAKDQVMPEMEAAGIDDPSLKWAYQNPDGTIAGEIIID